MSEEANGPTPPKLDWAKLLWEVTKGIAIGLAAVFSFFANQNSEKAKTELEQARVALEQKSQQSQLDIKAYEFVENTLALPPKARNLHGGAAAAIVSSLTQPPLRGALQSALLEVLTDPKVKEKLANALKFDLEDSWSSVPDGGAPSEKQSSLPDAASAIAGGILISPAWAQSVSGALRGYRVDIFYCEAPASSVTAARKARADGALEKLNKSAVPPAARVRQLPSLVQARPGYKSFSDEIRFNDQGNEKEAATELGKIIGIQPESVHQIDFRTSKYISVFYCA